MRRLVWILMLMAAVAARANAQAERPSDRGVRDLMEAIDKGRDRFDAEVSARWSAGLRTMDQAFGPVGM